MANETATLDLRNADAALQQSALSTYDAAMQAQANVTAATKQGLNAVQQATQVEQSVMQVTDVAAGFELDKIAEAMQKIDVSRSEIFGGLKGLFNPDYDVEHQQRQIDMSQFNLRRIAMQQELARRATERLKTNVGFEVNKQQADVALNMQRMELMDKGMATQRSIEDYILKGYDFAGLKKLRGDANEIKRMGVSAGAIERAIVAEEKRLLDIKQQHLSMQGMAISNDIHDMEREQKEKARWIDLHTPAELGAYITKAEKNGGRIQVGNAVFTTLDLKNAQVKRFNDEQASNKQTLDTLTQTMGITDQLNANGESINNAVSNILGYGSKLVEPPLGADGKVDPKFANLSILERIDPNSVPVSLRPVLSRAQQYLNASRDESVTPEYKLTYQAEALRLSNQLRDGLVAQQLQAAPKGTKEAHAQFLANGVIGDDAAAFSFLGTSLNNRNAISNPVYSGAYGMLSDSFTGLVRKNGGQAEIDMDSPDIGMALLNIGGKKQSADVIIRQAADAIPAEDKGHFSNGVTEKFVTNIVGNGIVSTLINLSATEQASQTPMYRGLVDPSGRLSSSISSDGAKIDPGRLYVTLEQRTQALRKSGQLTETQSLREDFDAALRQNIARFDLKPHTTAEAAFQRAVIGSDPLQAVNNYINDIARQTPEQLLISQRNREYDAGLGGATEKVGVTLTDPTTFVPGLGQVSQLKRGFEMLFGSDKEGK